jgi:hypothetical protein
MAAYGEFGLAAVTRGHRDGLVRPQAPAGNGQPKLDQCSGLLRIPGRRRAGLIVEASTRRRRCAQRWVCFDHRVPAIAGRHIEPLTLGRLRAPPRPFLTRRTEDKTTSMIEEVLRRRVEPAHPKSDPLRRQPGSIRARAATVELDRRTVRSPGILVDAVVVSPAEDHQQTFAEAYNPAYTGEPKLLVDVAPASELDRGDHAGRRCSSRPNAVVNLGIGIPEGVAAAICARLFAPKRDLVEDLTDDAARGSARQARRRDREPRQR